MGYRPAEVYGIGIVGIHIRKNASKIGIVEILPGTKNQELMCCSVYKTKGFTIGPIESLV